MVVPRLLKEACKEGLWQVKWLLAAYVLQTIRYRSDTTLLYGVMAVCGAVLFHLYVRALYVMCYAEELQ